MFDTSPGRAKVVGLANVEISVPGISSIRRLSPVELPIGAPAAVTACFMISEVHIWNARITDISWRVSRVSTNNMVGSATIISHQRRLDRESQTAVETEGQGGPNSHPASQDVWLICRQRSTGSQVSERSQVRPGLIVASRKQRILSDSESFAVIVAVRHYRGRQFRSEEDNVSAKRLHVAFDSEWN